MTEGQKATAEKITQTPGIGIDSARAIISVIGDDLERFPNDSCFSKWAGLCPGNNESAGKRFSGRTTKGNSLLRTTLIVCAHSAIKVKDSYFSAQYKRISAHRGSKRAYVAVAHSMLKAIYHMIRDNRDYTEGSKDLLVKSFGVPLAYTETTCVNRQMFLPASICRARC